MKKVVTGQSFKPKATTWNSFIDAAVYVKQRQAGVTAKTPSRDSKSGVVLVRNATGQELKQFAIVSLGDLIITPSGNEPEFRGNIPVFEAELITDENLEKPYGILQKPLQQSECGPAMLAGITPAKVVIDDENHEFAVPDTNGLKSSKSGLARILWKEPETGEKWAVLLLGGAVSTACRGPFEVVKKDESTVTVKAFDGEDFPYHNWIIAGVELLEADTDVDLDVSGDCSVFLHVSWSEEDSVWEFEFTVETSEPSSADNCDFYFEVAEISWDSENDKIASIIQKLYQTVFIQAYQEKDILIDIFFDTEVMALKAVYGKGLVRIPCTEESDSSSSGEVIIEIADCPQI